MADAQNLIEAAGTGDAERVQVILDAGFDVNTPNGGGETALIRAAGNGQAEMVRLLVRHGADVNAKSADGMTPLIRAAFFGHPEAARVLMMRGADLSVKDRLGSTAMDWALAKGHDEVAETLSQPVPAETEEETLIQQLPQAKPVEAEPQTLAAIPAEHSIEPRQAPPAVIPRNVVAEASPAAAAAEEASEEELTIPREVIAERKEKRAARAPRPPAATPPVIARQEIPIAHPVEKSNRLHVVLTTVVIFLVSGAVVYAITAGLRGSAVNQRPPESSVEAPPPTIIADPTPAATPARNRTEAETQPATAFDAGAPGSHIEPATENPAPVASAERSVERRTNNRGAADTATRTVRVVESREPTRTPSRTERVVESRRNVAEEGNNDEQNREAAVRRPAATRESAVQRAPTGVSSPAPTAPAPKKKVIQWP